ACHQVTSLLPLSSLLSTSFTIGLCFSKPDAQPSVENRRRHVILNMLFPVLAFATPNEAKTLPSPKCPIFFCGVHNATKADQGNLTCSRAFWKV
ncbi:unnamed protein product, partial [Hymenolepis diminuta]